MDTRTKIDDNLFGLSEPSQEWLDLVTDDEVIDAILSVPAHYVSATYLNSQSNTGVCTLIQPAGGAQVTWNLTSLSISQAGPTVGPNAKLTIYDGAIGGAVLFAAYLSAPGAGFSSGGVLGGSCGIIQEIPLPLTPQGQRTLQATPGNALSIQVTGTGGNQVSINARISDGLP